MHLATDSQLATAASGRFAVVFGPMMENLTAAVSERNIGNQANQTELALIAIARYFGSVPGRKNLVWVSSFFPLSLGGKFDTKFASTRSWKMPRAP